MNPNDRKIFNEGILRIITEAVKLHPDWRFHQILDNLNITSATEDRFYEESIDTLKNIKVL